MRNKYVAQMKSWIGRNEYDGSYHLIIDTYNTIKPLPAGYKMGYYESWCATTVSAAAVACGIQDIIPLECSCGRMIQKAQQMGIWNENDAYVPKPGDIIMYDWDDKGTGDCTGWPEHVGVVESCDGTTIHVIEGNINDSVGRRSISVNGRYIRGFVCPKFSEESNTATVSEDREMKFKLLQDMNMRKTPNGVLVQTIPSGAIIYGNQLQATGTTQWLNTSYNGKTGYVAVLPESKKYAVEIKEPEFIFTLDSAGANGISGWLYDGTDETYELHCYINDHGFNSIYANIFRQDLKDAGIGNGKHGFNWDKDLYEIFGNGTFDMSIFVITESGSNPCVYDGEITIYKEPEVEVLAKVDVPATPATPVPAAPDYTELIENLNKTIEEVSLKTKNIEIEVDKYASVVQTIDTNLKTLKEKLEKVINAL